jgi:predicted transcriptional regulator
MGFSFTSCNETKKETEEVVTEVTEETTETVDAAKEVVSEELAMAVYQCPMKCEAEKTYAEAGTCPKCEMDLKKVEVAAEESAAVEESHEGHDHE